MRFEGLTRTQHVVTKVGLLRRALLTPNNDLPVANGCLGFTGNSIARLDDQE